MVDFLGSAKPFSLSFGLADTRKHCMDSAIKLYHRLLLKNPEQKILHFDIIASLATDAGGYFQEEKANALIRLFRPYCKGDITMLNFVKACDKIYKRLRLFRATVVNSNQLDDALEIILNCFFYVLLTCLILVLFHVDPLKIFLSTASLSVSLSFAIGNASSKWFEVCHVIYLSSFSLQKHKLNILSSPSLLYKGCLVRTCTEAF